MKIKPEASSCNQSADRQSSKLSHHLGKIELMINNFLTSRRWLQLFLKTGSAIGLGLFLLLIIGYGFGQWWAKRNLAPILTQELAKSLKRPIKIGEIEHISLNELRISSASIPASGRELNRADVKEIIINFNPLKLAFDRTLKLDIQLVEPRLYLPRNAQGNWVEIPAQEKMPAGPIKIQVGSIKIDNAQVMIVPNPKLPQPINISRINLQVQVDDRQQEADFTGRAQFGLKGQVQLNGKSLIATGATEVTVKGQKLDAAVATQIVEIPQTKIERGTVDGDLKLAVQPQKYLRISSNLLVHDGKLIINHVPRSLDEINGPIQVSERQIKFNNVTTKYDRVAGLVNGTLDFQTGYQLQARTAPITLPDLFKSIDVTSPFPIAGAALGELQLTGKLDRPILAGKFANSQVSQVDRVQVDRVNGTFRLADGRIKIQATAQPKLGGKITTQGEVKFLKTPLVQFQIQGDSLPGDTLTQLYGAKLPPQIRVGTAAVIGTIGGTGANIYTNLHIKAPQATYPLSTDLQINPQGNALIRGATVQVAGGKVQATGAVTHTNWDLNLQSQELDTQKLAQIGGANLPSQYVGKLAGNMRVAGLNHDLENTSVTNPIEQQLRASGKFSLQLAAGKIIADRVSLDRGHWQADVSSNQIDLQELDRSFPDGVVSGNFRLSGRDLKQIQPKTIFAQGKGKIELDGGEIQSDNLRIGNGNWQGTFTTDRLDLDKFNPQVNGQLSGRFNLAGNLQRFTPASIRGVGSGTVSLPQGKITSQNFEIDRGKWQGNLQLSSLVLGGLSPQIPIQFRAAKLDGNVRIGGDLQQLTPNRIKAIGDGKLSWSGGTVSARQLALKAGKWRGNFAVNRVKLGSISNVVPTGFESAQLTGNFTAAGDLDKFNPNRFQLFGNGEVQLANGKVQATGLQLDRGNWATNLAITNLQLGRITDLLSPQLSAAQLNGNFNLAGNLNRSTPTTIQASGKGNLSLPNGGKIGADNFRLAAGQWQSDLLLSSLSLGDLNQQLPRAIQAGKISANLRASGNLLQPEPAQIRANGRGNVENILGGNIQIGNLILNNGQWQTEITASQLKIAELAKFAPKNSIGENQLDGKLSGNLQLAGNVRDNDLAKLQVLGTPKLTNFRVGTLKFDPNLLGKIQATPGQGVSIDFTGGTDRLALTLDRNLQPQTFAIQQQGVIANGNIDRQLASVNVERFPISLFQQLIPANVGIGQYRLDGTATGKLAINLANFQVAGQQIEITNPTFGAFQGDRLLANFRYQNGQLNLDDTEIQRGKHNYLISARVNPGAKTPTFQAKLKVPNGSLEDVRDLLQIFSINDVFVPLTQRKYGTVADLYSPSERIGNRPQPLYNELRRLSELRRWLNRETDRQQANNIIPDLGRLQGNFNGNIEIASNPRTGISADFNIQGQNWQLERYNLDRILAQGNWRNGKLHLAPLTLAVDNSQMTLAGDFAAKTQSAQLNIQNVPTDWLTNLVELPLNVSGGIDLTAQIGGNVANPRFNGNLSLHDGLLNQTRLKSAEGNFSYADGRLNFDSNAILAGRLLPTAGDPIKITGSVPYQLPFTLKPPASRAMRIELNLENQGLQVLDVLSKQQLQWIDGKGKVAVKISGNLKSDGGFENVSAKGIASINQGKIQSLALPEPLQAIDSEIVFDFDRIDVQKFTGRLATATQQGDRGQVAMMGIIPISDSFAINPSQRLNIAMKGIAVNLKEKYSGDVDGKLTIEGNALNPILTGELKLSNGQVFLPDSPNTTATVLGLKPAIPDEKTNNSLQLRNLQLTLGDNLQITRPPILSFLATGKLDIDGTLDSPRPFGQVQLQKGAVNLFTTQFRLANGYPQTADFFPTLGTEPVLNLRLAAKALESTASPLSGRNSIARTAKGSEINETADFYGSSLGSVQTVQVEARIAGLASQITQRLELTSTPNRTQPEILLLLGGGLVERIGAGDNNIGLGIANLAGSTLLNNIQDKISDALSLSDFRLFPTVTKDAKTSSSSTLGIAAEVGIEITPKISTSVFKILTNSESPQYSLRYRLSDQTLFRSSTNLFGDNRAILEFEQRF